MHVVGNGLEIGFFDERAGDASRLAAVVVRRGEGLGMQTMPFFSKRGLTSMLAFWLSRYIPLLRRRNLQPPAFEPLPEGFNSASGEGSSRMLYSQSMRKVRFGDVDYPLGAEGLTTVILVDDRCVPRRITVRTMTAPTVARPRMDRSLEKSEMLARFMSANRLMGVAWNDALLADPVIREFTEGVLLS